MNLRRLSYAGLSLPIFIVLIGGCNRFFGVMAGPSEGQIFNPIVLKAEQEDSKIAVVKWLAFGSGCRTVKEVPSKDRDVDFAVVPRNEVSTSNLKFDLTFSQFGLGSGKQHENEGVIEMYSECALRFAIKGQPGRRVKKIEGLSKLDIQKDMGSSLLLINELRFGQFGFDERKIEYDENTEIKMLNLDLELSKDLAVSTADGRSSCGSDQILNYDFTLYAKKPRKDSKVTVSFAPPKRAFLKLEFEDCKD